MLYYFTPTVFSPGTEMISGFPYFKNSLLKKEIFNCITNIAFIVTSSHFYFQKKEVREGKKKEKCSPKLRQDKCESNFSTHCIPQIKRFNDDVGCAPAPNHYDSKLPVSKKSGFSVVKSARFEERKEQTPGPGQYLTAPDGFVRPSPQTLQRSASFRVSSAKRGSKTDLSR